MQTYRPEYYETLDKYFGVTAIRDKKTIDFINSIKSRYLRAMIRNHFEHECSMRKTYYDLEDFKKEFKSYLDHKELGYFIYGLNDHYEDILKKLLGLEKWDK